jgi:hypothetical protein
VSKPVDWKSFPRINTTILKNSPHKHHHFFYFQGFIERINTTTANGVSRINTTTSSRINTTTYK